MGINNKIGKLFKLCLPAAAIFAVFLFAPILPAKADLGEPYSYTNTASAGGNAAVSAGSMSAAQAISYCQNTVCIATPDGFDCSAAFTQLLKCTQTVGAAYANLQVDTVWVKYAKDVADKAAVEALRTTLATAFKTSLKTFARSVAHDTAVWVASGGKGQKPLFITEGWGAYVKNAADSALGDFIDGVGTKYGMDLCQPNFQVKLAIKAGLDYTRQRQVRCSFSTIMNNWQSAINNASFALDYREALRPGANDISFALILADQRNSYVATAKENAAKTAEIGGLWKDITNVAGQILTPGTVIANTYIRSQDKADIGYSTFTNTVADIVEEFLNTLVSQLIKNLQSGLFSGSGNNNNNSSGYSPDLSGLSALFNPNSSPIVSGVAGAKLVFANLITDSNTKVGGNVDILLKLATCPDAAKANPGPTDCVIDSLLSSAIKEKKYVADLDSSIKNRLFAPQINSKASLDTVISSRSISIMREYRIVPVGWEFAAQVIKSNPAYVSLTLNDVMNCFYGAGHNNCNTNDFKGMIDPYWVLKAPETFCRRVGYTAYNALAKEQNNTIQRNQDCVDQQQCLQEDAKGNCINYGYCTQERRVWDVGKTCESKYNTCETFKSTKGVTTNWLKNTLDFENCTANNAGCRSYATNFNFQSKEWNGDYVSTTNGQVYSYSKFLDSSLIEVTLDPAWRVPENHIVSANRRLSLGVECNRTSCGSISGCVYNEAGKYCTMKSGSADTGTNCIVPAGGISCYVDSCYGSANLISGMNSGFETQDSGLNTGDAKYWTDELSYSDGNNRHYRAATAGLSGAGLRALSANNQADLITTLPNVPIDPNSSYKLKFAIRGTISQGSVIVAMVAGDSPYNSPNSAVVLGGQSFASNVGAWTQVEMPIINSGSNATGTIVIVTPAGSITDIALDSFELYKLKTECSAAGVKLFSSPQVQADPTNIYFNSNAQTCSSDAFGCSQFIRTKADLGNNLLYNGGLEYGKVGWASQDPAVSAVEDGAALIRFSGDSYQTYPAIEVEPNGYYAVSYDAAQIAVSRSDNAIFEMALFNSTEKRSPLLHVIETNCRAATDNTINLDDSPSGTAYQRRTCYFRAPSDAHVLTFKLFASNQTFTERGHQLKVDNIKIEKVSYPNFSATPYSSYDPSTGHSADQVAYINQAPDYLGCYKTLGGAWPTTAFELNSLLAKRAPECSNFADVCMQSEVGCELYSPVNGDPQIPGVVDGLDICPSECSGYQVYKQEATNFIADASFKQFIADKNAKYCSAAYAGCDEFTNLDQSGQGAENREYYVNFKACQKPASDDAAYYTWEGSDVTGYQLKAYDFKRSNAFDPENGGNGNAPCTDLAYNADGSNICQDSLQPAPTDSRTAAGICGKEDMAGNSDCREFYDTEGNVHYRLLSKTVTAADNCHPYRRTQTESTAAAAQADCQGTHGWWKASTAECIYMAVPAEGTTCTKEVAGCRAYTGNRGNNVRNVLSASNFTSATTSDNLWSDGNGSKDGIMISSESTYPGGNSLSNKVNSVDGTGSTNYIIKHQVKIFKNHTYTLSFWAKGNISFNPDSIMFTSNNAAKDAFSAGKLAGDNLLSPRVTITSDWKRYDLGPVFVTWDPTGDNDYLSFNLPGGAKIYLDNIVLKELNNNIYAIENSWYTPVSCDNKLDDADGKKAVAAGNCQDASTGRCSTGEMLGCTAYKDRASTVWYLRSFNSLCRRAAVGCEALLSTHNSESALPETFNAGGPNYDDVSVPADNLVYLVNDGTNTCSAENKGCTALGLPTVDKWDNITGYQTVFIKNNPTRYATDLCNHSELWCDAFAANSSVEYFKDPHGKTCDYVSGGASAAAGWFKTGTNERCVPESLTGSQFVGGGPNMSFGTGYEPATNKIQPFGPYSDVQGDVRALTGKDNNRLSNYQGFAGNCTQAAAGCSEYVDPDPTIYTNYLSPKDLDGTKLTADLKQIPGYTLYDFTNVSLTFTSCRALYPFGDKSNFIYFSGGDNCDITVTSSVADRLTADAKVSKAGVYYALSGSVDGSSCNGTVDFKSGCILLNSRNSIDYNRTSTAERSINYLTYDAVATKKIWDAQVVPNPVSPQLPASYWQADSNMIVRAGANRTCEKWLECTTYQKTGDSTQNYRFDNQDQCLNFGICDFRRADGSCGRWETADAKEVTKDNFAGNMSGFTIPNKLPVASMDQYGNSASVPNSNFETVVSGTTEPIGWIMNASSSDLNNDGWKAYKYAVEGKQQYLKFDSGYLALNSIYAVTSEAIDVQAGPYALDFWVFAQDLKPETAKARIFITSEAMNSVASGFDTSKANIQIQNDTNVRAVLMDGQYWITSDSLKATSGLPWIEKTLLIKANAKDTISIKLMNFDDEALLLSQSPSAVLNLDARTDTNYSKCYDLQSNLDSTGKAVGKLIGKPDFNTACNITGSALFDNISLKSALRTNNRTGAELNQANVPAPSELISRSCRAYPASDARSCQYSSGGNFYYGWYGYCLMDDPDNPGQCLQWYPIDQLKGDVVDEYSGGYSDQSPLFYCAETGKITAKAEMKASAGGVGGTLTSLISKIPGLSSLSSSFGANSTQGKTTSFTLDHPETNNLFRYPMITHFSVGGFTMGLGYNLGRIGIGFTPFNGTLYRNSQCPNTQNDLSCSPLDSITSVLSQAVPTDGSSTLIQGFISQAIAAVTGSSDFSNVYNQAVNLTASITQTAQTLAANEWKGAAKMFPVALPIGEIYIGIPIAVPWSLAESKIMGGVGATDALATAIDGALAKLVQSGPWAFAVDGTTVGLKVVSDSDPKYASKFTDLSPSTPGNILGVAWGASLGSMAGLIFTQFNVTGNYDVYYCKKVVQVVTAAGQNKAWVNRVSRASQFTFLPQDKTTYDPSDRTDASGGNFFAHPYQLNVSGANPDIDPATLGYRFDGYNADYKPFGSLVPPATDSQNPYLWTSYVNPTTQVSTARYPLFWDSPNLNLTAPYQARMGQPESPDGLKNLFAKSYAAWKWVGNDQTSDATAEQGGSYQPIVKKGNVDEYNKFVWDLPTDYCETAVSDWAAVKHPNYVKAGYVRDMNERKLYCLIRPEVMQSQMKVNDYQVANGTLELAAGAPAKLDFTVRIDRDQLPLTSYAVDWGDGSNNITSVTGVKLRARANPENPFTLYHMYDMQKVKDAAGTCAGFNQSGCSMHYCDSSGSCYVKINVSVTDNWRAEGSAQIPFVIHIK